MVLDHLCEFIEDCEFPDLAVQILQVLADQSTHVKYPARFIRYVYNRVVLEVEPVRAGAVSALAKIGATNESLSEAVTVLLKRCMTDVDDEVRDRATVLSSMLAGTEGAIGVLSHPTQARALIATPLTTPLPQLDASLAAYLAAGDFSSPFGLDKLVSYREPVANSVASSISADLDGPKSGLLAAVSNATREEVNPHLATLNSIPEIAALGPVFRSSKAVELTEAESEFGVACIKHIYENHVVLQFNITNTLEGQWIDQISVELDLASTEWTEDFAVPCGLLGTGATGVAFSCLTRPEGTYALDSASATLKYTLKDDEDDAGFPDEYSVEAVDIAGADFVRASTGINLLDFRRAWESLSGTQEAVKKYSLSMNDLQQAVDAVLEFVGLSAVESSDRVPEGAQSHAVNLVGTFLPNTPVYARAGFMVDAKLGVALKIAARCEQDGVAPLITNSIH